jgi:hypothetical protein
MNEIIRIKNMFEIKYQEIFPALIHLHFKTQYEITSTMMRLQEFYESPYGTIRGQYFDLEEYMDTYAENMENFTYTADWSGFNVPGNVVNMFFTTFDEKLLRKEEHLKNILNEALKKFNIKGDNFYLIASYEDKEEGKDVLKHEIGHGLYYLNKKYKEEMRKIILKIPEKIHKQLEGGLKEQGYTDIVIPDEIQAYFSTSDMLQLCEDFKTEELPWELVLECKKVFEKYYEEIEKDET